MTIARITTLALGAAALFATVPAAAAPYFSGTVGATFPQDLETSAGVSGKLKTGYAIIGAVGTTFGPVRGELEGSYRRNNVGGVDLLGIGFDGTGNASALSGMANVYFDLPLLVVRPYVGGGIGVTRLKANDVSAYGLPPVPPYTSLASIDASTTAFAYQLMAGIGFTFIPGVTTTIGYRWFATPGYDTGTPIGDIHINGLKVSSVEVGFRFGF